METNKNDLIDLALRSRGVDLRFTQAILHSLLLPENIGTFVEAELLNMLSFQCKIIAETQEDLMKWSQQHGNNVLDELYLAVNDAITTNISVSSLRSLNQAFEDYFALRIPTMFDVSHGDFWANLELIALMEKLLVAMEAVSVEATRETLLRFSQVWLEWLTVVMATSWNFRSAVSLVGAAQSSAWESGVTEELGMDIADVVYAESWVSLWAKFINIQTSGKQAEISDLIELQRTLPILIHKSRTALAQKIADEVVNENLNTDFRETGNMYDLDDEF